MFLQFDTPRMLFGLITVEVSSSTLRLVCFTLLQYLYLFQSPHLLDGCGILWKKREIVKGRLDALQMVGESAIDFSQFMKEIRPTYLSFVITGVYGGTRAFRERER